MQINKIQPYNTTFSSRFVPTKTLESVFDEAIKNGDKEFLKSVKAIMDDGFKRDIKISVNIRNGKYDMTTLTYDGKKGGYWSKTKSDGQSATKNIIQDVMNVINNFAKTELKLNPEADSISIERAKQRLVILKRSIFKNDLL